MADLSLLTTFIQKLPRSLSGWLPAAQSRPAGLSWQDFSPPELACTLGRCADGLPVLLDLGSPAAGALLVCADPRSGKTALMQAALASLLQDNPAEMVQYLVISPQPRGWEQPGLPRGAEGQALGIFSPRDPAALDWLDQLVEEMEHRFAVSCDRPAVLALIDGLDALLQSGPRQRASLEALILNGPQVGLWPVCSLETAAALRQTRLLRLFGTILAGRINDAQAAERICLSRSTPAAALRPGQFAFPIGPDWKAFSPAAQNGPKIAQSTLAEEHQA